MKNKREYEKPDSNRKNGKFELPGFEPLKIAGSDSLRKGYK